ncbi:methionine--tRNA ligase subunit beta [Candidatus Kaiserbacteria bacterium]|nr:methionine--tRNA ligase subunit beta [Candidatus Kaiserbacteria bacterium]USN92600.1 MAG: methionine--tRNA ligase subunit beta [Candidatus Nomurabacteria bacterium]
MNTNINYDDFAKLEIRVGTIKEVEVVEDADKLLKLTVDLGEAELRQIVSGIREYYEDPEVLVGKQCPFVANLEPRTIRGLESQGMILAGSADGDFALFHPDNKLPPGTLVS